MRHDLRRTLLTMLGMAWGIATVVLLLAYGDGFGQAIHTSLKALARRRLVSFRGALPCRPAATRRESQVRFTDADVDVLRNVLPAVPTYLPPIRHDGDGSEQSPGRFPCKSSGIDPRLQSIWNLKTAEGRFVNDQDNCSHGLYAVLGSEAKDKLFSGMTALGQTVGINGVSFEVVGVLQPRMQEQADNDNRVLYIPYNSMDVLQDIHYIGGIWLDSRA